MPVPVASRSLADQQADARMWEAVRYAEDWFELIAVQLHELHTRVLATCTPDP